MSVIRVGSSSTYATGWDVIFGGGGSRPGTKKQSVRKSATTGKSTRKKAAKKAAAANVGRKPKRPLKTAGKRG